MHFQNNFYFSIKEKDVILQKLHSAESQLKSQVSKLESDLEDQRARNNVSVFIIIFCYFVKKKCRFEVN